MATEMQDRQFQRLLQLFPVIRSSDYCMPVNLRSLLESVFSLCCSYEAHDETPFEEDRPISQVLTLEKRKEKQTDTEGPFWTKLKKAAEPKLGQEGAEKFFQAFRRVHEDMVYKRIGVESVEKIVKKWESKTKNMLVPKSLEMEHLLVSAYRAMEPTSLIISMSREIGNGSLTEQVQQIFLDKCVKDEICRRFPPSLSYMRSLLKQFILAAEAESGCVLDGICDEYAALLSSSEEVSRVHRTYTYVPPGHKHSGTVTLCVSNNMLEGDTGCYCWPAGLYLAEFLLSFPSLVKRKRCIELGSGAGMVGICLSRLQPSQLILTDGNISTLDNLKHNLQINQVHSATTMCKQLLWESPQMEDLHADIILGADIVYNPACIPHLVQVLAHLLNKDGGQAFVATAKRNPETLSAFICIANESNLMVTDITNTMVPHRCLQGLTSFDRSAIILHKIVAKQF